MCPTLIELDSLKQWGTGKRVDGPEHEICKIIRTKVIVICDIIQMDINQEPSKSSEK